MTTLRASAPVATFWTAAVVTAVLVFGALVSGDWRAVAAAIAPGGLIVWVCWVFLYHPAVRFDDGRVVAVNLGRVVEMPWARVAGVRQRYQLVFDLDDGTHVACWGGPMSARPASGIRTRTAGPRPSGDRIASELETLRVRAAAVTDAAPPVIRRWDVPTLAVGAALVAAVALQLALR